MALEELLTDAERSGGVAYTLIEPVDGGTRLDFPQCPIDVPWEAAVVFVDRDPLANWGHSCRYFLVSRQTGEVRSIDARFPPFRPGEARRWRVLYAAPSLPDHVVHREE